MNLVLLFYTPFFRKFQGNCDSSTHASTCLSCFLPFAHYTLLKLFQCYAVAKRKAVLKKKKKKKISLLERTPFAPVTLGTTPSPGTTQEFTIEFDKILVDTSFLHYSPPPPPRQVKLPFFFLNYTFIVNIRLVALSWEINLLLILYKRARKIVQAILFFWTRKSIRFRR